MLVLYLNVDLTSSPRNCNYSPLGIVEALTTIWLLNKQKCAWADISKRDSLAALEVVLPRIWIASFSYIYIYEFTRMWREWERKGEIEIVKLSIVFRNISYYCRNYFFFFKIACIRKVFLFWIWKCFHGPHMHNLRDNLYTNWTSSRSTNVYILTHISKITRAL